MTGPGERIFALLLRLYRREFRHQYREELIAFFRQDREHPKYGSGPLRPIRFWTATVRDLLRAAASHRRAPGPGAYAARGAISSRLQTDLRFAWRGLWAAPGVTLSALAVLTLGIGAGTAVFSVVDAVALRGLPFAEGHRLVSVAEADLKSARPGPVAPQNLVDWRARQHVFDELAGTAGAPPFTATDEPVETWRVIRVTGPLFDLLRVAPARGRVFRPDDERPGAPPVAILSDGVWRRRFNADPGIVGRTIAAGSGTYQIVGVMPTGFTYPISSAGAFDAWLPFIPSSGMIVRDKSRTYTLSVVGRLKSGVTLETASAEMGRIRDQLAIEYPRWFEDKGVGLRPLRDAVVGASIRSWMLLLLGAVAVVVLIACLNAANLLVARAVSRGPELAIRAALGASRGDLVRGLVVESLLLSLLGAGAGVLAALWGVEVLRAAMPVVPRLADVAVDLRVLTVAALAALTTGIVFGMLPALQASRPDVVTLLGQAGRSQSGGRTTRRVRSALVIAEVSMAVVLLSGSGLFMASFIRVTSVELGFDPRHVVSISPGATMGNTFLKPATDEKRQAETASGHALVRAALERLRAVPGVIAAAEAQGGRPLSGSYVTTALQHVDRKTAPVASSDEPVMRSVGPRFLDVMRGAMARGRWIAETDVTGSAPVVVLSDEAARRYFGSRDPLGQSLLFDDYERTVVGVVRALRTAGPEAVIRPEAYIPFFQTSHQTTELLVRTQGDPAALVRALKDAVRPILPQSVAREPELLERDYATLLRQRKFNMIILGLFGTVAVLIAAVGIYGLMAFMVAQRRREIGVRVALGAAPAGILRMVIGRATRLMVAGLVLGLGLALLLEQTIRTFLFNARPHDPVIYGGVAVVLFVAGLAASLGPARRAARVDPLIALRTE